MHWSQQEYQALKAKRIADHDSVEARRQRTEGWLRARRKRGDQKLSQISSELNDPQLLKETGFSAQPTRELSFVKAIELRSLFRIMLAIGSLESINVAFGTSVLIGQWNIFSVILLITGTALLVSAAALTGHVYRSEADKPLTTRESPFRHAVRLVSSSLPHVLTCSLVGGMTAMRVWSMNESSILEKVEAGLDPGNTQAFGYLATMIAGGASFALSWTFAKLFHQWRRLRDKWIPWYRLYEQQEISRRAVSSCTSRIESIPMTTKAAHSEVDYGYQTQLASFARRIEIRLRVYEFFHASEYGGREVLDAIRVEKWN